MLYFTLYSTLGTETDYKLFPQKTYILQIEKFRRATQNFTSSTLFILEIVLGAIDIFRGNGRDEKSDDKKLTRLLIPSAYLSTIGFGRIYSQKSRDEARHVFGALNDGSFC